MSGDTLVVGGGISGLVAAVVLAQRGKHVTLVESETQLGGLLRRLDYGEAGVFDCGMHNMYETGVAELDEMLFGLLPENEWQILEGAKRDLAGVYVDNRLQINSPYVDLRSHSAEVKHHLLGDLMLTLAHPPIDESMSAGQFARAHLGETIARMAILPAMRKLFHRDPEDLDQFAVRLTPLTRVVLFDETEQIDLMQSSLIRSRIAYPEQRRLPHVWSAQRRGYYPKKFGIHRVIDALRSKLDSLGATVLTGTKIVAIDRRDGCVQAVECVTPFGGLRIGPLEQIVWTAALPALAPLLGIKLESRRPDKPLRTVVTNLLLHEPPEMDDLYYIYCYQPGFDCFRVTNYSGYCENAARRGGYPVCHEMLIEDSALEEHDLLVQKALFELVGMGVIESTRSVAFARTEVLLSGFPMPTVNNVKILDELRDAIDHLDLANLHLTGIMSQPGLFFQGDVLAHTYSMLGNHG